MAAKYLAYRAAGVELSAILSDKEAVRRFAKVAQLWRDHGHGSAQRPAGEHGRGLSSSHQLGGVPDPHPAGLCGGRCVAPADGVPRLQALMKKNNERLRFQLVKIVTDGSIQGLSARMRWPGYYDGTPNGVWNIGPDDIDRILLAYHKAGFQVHIHTNGDEASKWGSRPWNGR